MKNLFNIIGLVAFIGLIVLNMITYKSCSNYKAKYTSEVDFTTSLKVKYDSILSLPADTITLPPEIIKGKDGKDSVRHITKWRDKPVRDSKIYEDSLINDSIDIKLQIKAKELYSIDYTYKPIYKYQKEIIEKKVPYMVKVTNEIKIPQSGLFLNAGLGFSDQFSAKLGMMYLTKDQTTYSYDLVRYGDINIHLLSYGIKF